MTEKAQPLSQRKHSEHAPSGATMWMSCPGSLNLISKLRRNGVYEESRSSVFAAEGTAAHKVREEILRFGFDPYDYIGDIIHADGFSFTVDDDMVEALIPGIDRINEFPGVLLVEVRIDITEWTGLDSQGNRQGGMLDAVKIDWYGKHILISDLKFGMGIAVQAVDNKQLRLYLLGLISMLEAGHFQDGTILDFTDWEFTIIIDQPRHAQGGGEWSRTYAQLMEFGEEVRAAAEATRDPNAPCIASMDGCRWCPAADLGACAAHEAWQLDFLGLEFSDLDADELELDDIDGLTAERMGFIVKHRGVIEEWLNRIHARVLMDALNGDYDSGLKAVDGRQGKRVHKDEKMSLLFMRKRAAELKLAEELLWKKTLISPAQGEKLLKLGNKKFPSRLVHQNDPKPSLVPVEDDRDAVTIEHEFENLDIDDDLDI